MKLKNILLSALGTTTLSIGLVPMVSCSNENHSVMLFANEGTFANQKKVIALNGTEGTTLSKIKNYVQPTLKDMQFIGWTDQNGQYIPEDTKINSDLILKANFVEPAKTPNNFRTDNWQTVLKVCDEGYIAFAKAYCGYTGNSEEDAKAAIGLWTVQTLLFSENPYEDCESVKPITFTRGIQTITGYVHIIGFDKDTIYGTNQKAKFTFEFMNIIDFSVYSNDHEFHHWYQLDGDNEKQAFIRKYLNEYVYNYLPVELRKAIKTVDKSSPDLTITNDGIIYNITNSHSPEKLFPLDMFENNGYAFLNANLLNKNPYNVLPGDAYSFYNYALAYLPYPELRASNAWKKCFYTYLDYENAPYWLRTGSVSIIEAEDEDPYTVSQAYAIYNFDGNVITCPGSPTDVANGIAPAFCI